MDTQSFLDWIEEEAKEKVIHEFKHDEVKRNSYTFSKPFNRNFENCVCYF